jgi:thiamine biosynthesis lipoprotein
LKLVDETPGAAALFQRVTPEGVKTFESSRFRQVPRVEGQDATTPADVRRP